MRLDMKQQLASYRGYLEWDAFNTPDGSVSYPKLSIELYLKTASLPVRRPKVAEINTLPTRDPMGNFDIRAQAVFFGAPDVLQTQLTGWILTPLGANTTWAPVGVTDGGTVPLNVGNVCYPEIIAALIEGRMNAGFQGMGYRKDPDRYITPYGEQYDNPIIGSYNWAFTQNRRKQTFDMTLWLDK